MFRPSRDRLLLRKFTEDKPGLLWSISSPQEYRVIAIGESEQEMPPVGSTVKVDTPLSPIEIEGEESFIVHINHISGYFE
jgi:hypothetical protein